MAFERECSFSAVVNEDDVLPVVSALPAA